jgi:hypothetical protein
MQLILPPGYRLRRRTCELEIWLALNPSFGLDSMTTNFLHNRQVRILHGYPNFAFFWEKKIKS